VLDKYIHSTLISDWRIDCLNYCVIYIVRTQFTNVPAGPCPKLNATQFNGYHTDVLQHRYRQMDKLSVPLKYSLIATQIQVSVHTDDHYQAVK